MSNRAFRSAESSLLALLLTTGFTGHAAAGENRPGGGTGEGPDVTVTDNGDGTVTMANGIVSIVIVKKTSRLDAVTYSYDRGGKRQTTQMLQGKGQYYYGGFMLGNGTYEYSLAADPAANKGNYADVKLVSDSETNGRMETHFSMLRGSPGYYSTAIMTHRKQDAAFEVGAWGVVTRVPPTFNWLSADDRRNMFIGSRTRTSRSVPHSPHEITVNLDGTRAGEFEDKFIYAQDHGDQRAWGWSSVGKGGLNVGIWMMTNMEFSNGGPLKRDVGVYPYSELNNSILTGELGMGSDGFLAAGEEWTKTCGPWFVYMNHVPAEIDDPRQAAHALYAGALAQAEAEKKAWPYAWFEHEKYVPAAGRGKVTGKFVIRDPGNPNASPAGLWVGLIEQPHTIKGYYDFQKWLRPYQFFTRTAADGSFSIPNVLPGKNYTLWAYGPGAAGTFVSQEQAGGKPPLLHDLPAQPFGVAVMAGQATDLGTVTWTPARVGATVFELGYPDRKAGEYRHGEDFWAPEKSPKLGYPTPVWGGQTYFPADFPAGMTYTVGKSRWATDWNYVLPSLPDRNGAYQPCSGTIAFELTKAPLGDALASIYLGFAGDEGGHVVVHVNGTDLATVPGVTAVPNAFAPGVMNPRNKGVGGFNPSYSDNSSIHFGDHGPFSDERITFPANLLRAGRNTITITKTARGLSTHFMVDYLRLELAGYVPPPPSAVAAFAGNGRALVRWPLAPGATSYNVSRAATPAGPFVTVASGLIGPVSGSGPSMAAYTDASVENGKTYYYTVQAVNPYGRSADSPVSGSVTPSADRPAKAPAAPAGPRVAESGHHRVALSWTPCPTADYYTIFRTTLNEDGVGGTYPLRTILLDDATMVPNFVDPSPTDGKIYSYHVVAVNAAGSSGPSASVKAIPLPAPPAAAPGSPNGAWIKTRQGHGITLTWSPVPGATGYVIYRSTSPDGPFRWPEDFTTTVSSTTYTEQNDDKKPPRDRSKILDPGKDYYYRITAVNAAGISPPVVVRVQAK
jgi:rhamnogalacturonan endolyase